MTEVIIDRDGDLRLKLPSRHQPEEASEPSEQQTDKDPVSEAADSKTSDGDDDKDETESTLVTVSSKVLSVASPVFKAMLGGKFREGAEFAARRAAAEQYTLSLPEDDAESTLVLLCVLHHNLAGLSDRPGPEVLENLAFTCDKYQCTHVLRYCGALWMGNWLADNRSVAPPVEDVCRMLVFAYVADLPLEFNDAAWKLLMYHVGPISSTRKEKSPLALVDHPLLRDDVADYIDKRRAEFCEAFHGAMMAPLNKDWVSLSDGCFRAAKAVGAYVKRLRSCGLMPHDLSFSRHKFASLFSSGSHDMMVPSPITTEDYTCSLYNCRCKADLRQHVPLTDCLRRQVNELREQKDSFVCLDCVKTDGQSKTDGKCRRKHKPLQKFWM